MLKTQLDYALKAKGFGNMSKFAKLTGIRRSTIDDWVKKIELLKKFVKWGALCSVACCQYLAHP